MDLLLPVRSGQNASMADRFEGRGRIKDTDTYVAIVYAVVMNALGKERIRPLLPAIQKRGKPNPSSSALEDAALGDRRRRNGGGRHSRLSKRTPKVIALVLLALTVVLMTATFGSAPLLPLPLFLEPLSRSVQKGRTQTNIALDSATELDTLNSQPSSNYCDFFHNTLHAVKSPPMCCAHGGDVDAGPPNTMLSFTSALRAGCTCLEVDVSMTKDGFLVALHDRDLDKLMMTRKSNVAAEVHVGDYTLAQLSQLRWPAAHSNESIVLVRDILEYVDSLSVDLIILDVKLREGVEEVGEARVMARAVADVLRATGCGNKCVVWAKHDAVMVSIKDINNDQLVGRVIVNDTKSARALGMQHAWENRAGVAEIAGLHWEMALPSFVSELRQPQNTLQRSANSKTFSYKRVIVWNANTAVMMTRALESTADGIVTSHPRRLLSAIQARREVCMRRRLQ